jgi:hypothetical protein
MVVGSSSTSEKSWIIPDVQSTCLQKLLVLRENAIKINILTIKLALSKQ